MHWRTKIFGHEWQKYLDTEGQKYFDRIGLSKVLPCVTDRVDSRVLLKGRTKKQIQNYWVGGNLFPPTKSLLKIPEELGTSLFTMSLTLRSHSCGCLYCLLDFCKAGMLLFDWKKFYVWSDARINWIFLWNIFSPNKMKCILKMSNLLQARSSAWLLKYIK